MADWIDELAAARLQDRERQESERALALDRIRLIRAKLPDFWSRAIAATEESAAKLARTFPDEKQTRVTVEHTSDRVMIRQVYPPAELITATCNVDARLVSIHRKSNGLTLSLAAEAERDSVYLVGEQPIASPEALAEMLVRLACGL